MKKKFLTNHERLFFEKEANEARFLSDWLLACSVLAIDDGYSIKDISSVLQISSSTIKKYKNDFHKKNLND